MFQELTSASGGFATGTRYQDEARLGSEQELANPARALAEALGHHVEGHQKLRQVFDERDAREAFDELQHGLAGAVEQPEAEPSGRKSRVDEELHDPAVEKLDQPLWCVEKIEGVLRRRGVDDDQVEVVPLAHLVDSLHGGILSASGQGV